MNTINDDIPCGVAPHAQASWRAKYEYMDRLWLQQKAEIAALRAQLQQAEGEISRLRLKQKETSAGAEEDPTCVKS